MRSQFPCENSEMSCEASVLLRRVAMPHSVGESVKVAITSVARAFGWRASRTSEIWYGRARRIHAEEMDALRGAANEQAARYEAISRAMDATDAGFYSADIAALVHAAHALRRMAGHKMLRPLGGDGAQGAPDRAGDTED